MKIFSTFPTVNVLISQRHTYMNTQMYWSLWIKASAKWTKVPSAGYQAVRSSEVCDWRTALLPVNTKNIVNHNATISNLASVCIISVECIPAYTVTGGSFLSRWRQYKYTITIQTPSLSMNMIAPSVLTFTFNVRGWGSVTQDFFFFFFYI